MPKQEDVVFWTKMQRCIECKKQDAYTLSGRQLCYECCEKAAIRRHNAAANDEDFYKKQYTHKKIVREERKSLGLCVDCGKRPMESGDLCWFCREKKRAYDREYYHKTKKIVPDKKPDENICTRCKKNPRAFGIKLCSDCYEKTCKSAWMGRKAQGPKKIPTPVCNSKKAREAFQKCLERRQEYLERWNAEYGVDRYEDRASNKKQEAGT